MIADRVKETTTTMGTGTVNLAGAVTAFQAFVAGIGDGNTCYYCIQSLSSGEWEVGIGTVADASPDTLSRDTILQSSNSDNAVDFSAGTKDVFLPLPADKALYRDADGDMPDAESWDGLQTFNAGVAIASGQGVTMADDTWIGIGSALERIVFDAAGDVSVMGANFGIGVTNPDERLEVNGNIHLSADGDYISFGAAGSTDYTIEWDGDDAVHTVTAGDFVFTGGNVGIGGVPVQLLDVHGSAYVRNIVFTNEVRGYSYGGTVRFDTDGMRLISNANEFITFSTKPSGVEAERVRILDNGNVGIGTASPIATFDINGGFAANLVTKTANYTATTSDHVILCNASGGAFTITLPAAAGVTGLIYHIKKTDSSANAVTIDGNSAETIDGDQTIDLKLQYESVMIVSDGSNWHII